ncbi:chromate transport protein [mine drainage metagenome]|uniref:Chromate transport protein n=1 Tax=mine drainage metagenome TaxID=410659 RepID=A0A1J5S7V9_9ZZZZ
MPPADRPAVSTVFKEFLRLGLGCFGGPMAHLGAFHRRFVTRLGWLDEHSFADLVGLCQFLPGPASSQVGFAIGLTAAGLPGAVAAWLGFTLPSAALMLAFAHYAAGAAAPWQNALFHGLKLAAVAIVAQAVIGMARALCQGRLQAGIALSAAAILAALGWSFSVEFAVLILGGVLGMLWLTPLEKGATISYMALISKVLQPKHALFSLAVFLGLLLASFLLPQPFWRFFRAGALVFGGGHVVLPLLQGFFVENHAISPSLFMSGYGAAQMMPGPLFSFAAFLGAVLPPPATGGLTGGLLGLLGVFLPGLLLLLAALPFWAAIGRWQRARAALAGVNAAVVGVLGMAFYNPVFTSAVLDGRDLAQALLLYALLTAARLPPILVVGGSALAALARYFIPAF